MNEPTLQKLMQHASAWQHGNGIMQAQHDA
jgi:hypothetical protein